MMWINLFLDSKKVDGFLEEHGYQEKSLVWILKKEVGFKNGYEIERKYDLLSTCLHEKVCWKNEIEYKEIIIILTKLMDGIKNNIIPKYIRGRTITRIWVDETGHFHYGYPYCGTDRYTLGYYQKEYIIKRWLQENF